MENEKNFYEHVSSWIKSYHNPDALHWLRRFINNSSEPLDIKEQLHREIDWKVAALRQQPCFNDAQGMGYLVDDSGHPRIYTTRFAAICKVAELKLKGYDVELQPGDVFYKIKLADPAPINQSADDQLQLAD